VSAQVFIAGVGMIPFAKPGQSEQYDVMAERAVRAALADAGCDYSAIQQAFVGFCFGDSCSGQQALYRVGLSGVPIVNVNNNCSTGSSALYLARQAVLSGNADVALAVGFEQEVLASRQLYGPVTRLQCCPPTCGAAAAVVVSAEYAGRHVGGRAIRIAAQSMTTDAPGSFEGSMILAVGYDMSRHATQLAYDEAGIDPRDVDVVELHDCFTTNEVISYEALGLVGEGQSEKFIADGDNTYGGRWVVNPSGGLLSKGHPLGATGLAQCAELVWQLRGEADQRQVADAKVALQHNIGLGGACVVTLYQR
jgi:acetyl-CoA acetyltransferase